MLRHEVQGDSMAIHRRAALAGLVAGPLAAGWAAPRRADATPAPIIDMHVHARRPGPVEGAPEACAPYAVWPRWDQTKPAEEGLVFDSGAPCRHPLKASVSGEAVMAETLALMERRNITAMVMGAPPDVARWKSAAPGRVLSAVDLRLGRSTRRPELDAPSPDALRALHAAGRLDALGEIMSQYEGVAPDDARLEAWWELAEELDIPAAIHMTGGNPADPYLGSPRFRARDGDPLKLEEVLSRHPKLRLWIMHAGYPYADNLRALLFTHPQVYVDIAAIVNTEPRASFYRWLQVIIDAGFGDRVMFGSDQGVWPQLIEEGIRSVERAPFLTPGQKRNILYNNAARFLRLDADAV